MTTQQLLTSAWSWNPALLLLCGAALAGYLAMFGITARLPFFLGALATLLFTLISPLNALADGYLFSAHMAQHILLLLVVPALLLRSLPSEFALWKPLRKLVHPLFSWLCGIGAMWLWHAPALCNASASSRPVYAVQTVSLLVMGCAFWWQVAAPGESQRLQPLTAVLYLFSACIACSVLGMIVTLSPVSVCTVYTHPVDRLGLLSTIRNGWGITPERDQQIGGLLMWVPMCLIYLSAIFAQLARWYGTPAPALATTPNSASN
jgi:putative membrane protein